LQGGFGFAGAECDGISGAFVPDGPVGGSKMVRATCVGLSPLSAQFASFRSFGARRSTVKQWPPFGLEFATIEFTESSNKNTFKSYR
jgi:hypothetical protein